MYTLFVCNFRQSLDCVGCVSYELAARTRILIIPDILPTPVVKQLNPICTFCLYESKDNFFKLSFDTSHALIGSVIVGKTAFEAGKETRMSLILFPSEAIWM